MIKCAFEQTGECTALFEKQCVGCAFYKTTEELKIGRQKATDKIKKLPLCLQNHIKLKYYTRGRRSQNW